MLSAGDPAARCPAARQLGSSHRCRISGSNAGDRVRAGDASAEHGAVDVRRDDQAGRPVSCRPAGAGPEPPMPARAQRAEEERALPRATPVDLAVIPRPSLGVPRQRHPQVKRDPAKLPPLPRPAAARYRMPHPRRPGKNGHSSTLRATSDMPWTCRQPPRLETPPAMRPGHDRAISSGHPVGVTHRRSPLDHRNPVTTSHLSGGEPEQVLNDQVPS